MAQALTIKAGQALVSLADDQVEAAIAHPAQQANVRRVAALIERLHVCETPDDYTLLQRQLFGYLYSAEEARGGCSRAIKRLRRGESVPPDAPGLPDGANVTALATWEFEAFVYERIARQLRCVGDGLAWRAFDYDRRVILTLSRNASPGPMYGKDGLRYELGAVEQLWNEQGRFALHHDLTNCLRIADLTEFDNDGNGFLREIKATPRADPKQLARAQAAVNALMNGGPMPDRADARLVEIAEPYVTNLPQLGDIIGLAKQRGCQGMRLSGGRALVAASLVASAERWQGDWVEAARVFQSARAGAIKRARIGKASHHLNGVSGDTATRSPVLAPWSIYPLAPADCAAIICDLLVFETVIAVEALRASLAKVGLQSKVLLPEANGRMAVDQDVLRVLGNGKALTVHAPSLGPLLYELVDLDTWARGIAEVMRLPGSLSEPVVVFADEARWWR